MFINKMMNGVSGVVGLAIAQRLSQRFPSKSTYLIERHGQAGEETRQVSVNRYFDHVV